MVGLPPIGDEEVSDNPHQPVYSCVNRPGTCGRALQYRLHEKNFFEVFKLSLRVPTKPRCAVEGHIRPPTVALKLINKIGVNITILLDPHLVEYLIELAKASYHHLQKLTLLKSFFYVLSMKGSVHIFLSFLF